MEEFHFMLPISYKEFDREYGKNKTLFKGFESFKKKSGLDDYYIKNKTAIQRASMSSSSQLNYSYDRIIKKNFGINIPVEKLKITPEMIFNEDMKQLEKFSSTEFNFKGSKRVLFRSAQQALRLMGLYQNRKFIPVSPEESCVRFPNTTSSAYPVYKAKSTDEARKQAVSWCESFLHKPKLRDLMVMPTTIFHRFQYKSVGIKNKSLFTIEDFVKYTKLQGNDFNINVKIRQVFALPYCVQTLEGIFFRDIIDNYVAINQSTIPTCATAGLSIPKVADNVITKLRSIASVADSDLMSLDIESFDSSVPSFMFIVFKILIKDYITFNNSNEEKAFDLLFNYYIHTPYILRSKDQSAKGGLKLKFQGKGIPSGSLITNFFGTFVNLTVIIYAYQVKSNFQFTDIDISNLISVLGDDNLCVLFNIDENEVIKTYKLFSLVVSEEKTFICSHTENVPFLGYIWNNYNEPIQTVPWYIVHAVFPSRFISKNRIPFGIDYLQTFRAISIFGSLKGGNDMLFDLVTDPRTGEIGDYILKQYYEEFNSTGTDPLCYLVLEDQRNFLYKFPFSIFIAGWRVFGGLLNQSVT